MKYLNKAFIFIIILVVSNSKASEYISYDIDDYEQEYTIKDRANDPFEKFNRKVFKVNMFLTDYLVNPIGKSYKFITTPTIRNGISNFLENLKSPLILANSLLQGDLENSKNTLSSFIVNTTIGFLGFGNPSQKWGFYRKNKDFAQTLYKYGLPSGPYIMLPVFGPSTLRAGFGKIVEFSVDPVGNNYFEVGGKRDLLEESAQDNLMALSMLNTSYFVYEVLSPMLEDSFDPYIKAREGYLQNRQFELDK